MIRLNIIMDVTKKNILVLNRNWYAIDIVGLPDAMNLLFSTYEDGEPKAKIITPPPKGNYEIYEWKDWATLIPEENDDILVGTQKSYIIPEVLLLSKYEKIPVKKVKFCRRELWKRDFYTCQFCGTKPQTNEFSIDHLLPISKGGKTIWQNVILACKKCNSQKADRLPENAVKPKNKIQARKWLGPSPMRLLKTPEEPKYSLFKTPNKILDSWKNWIS